MDPLFGIFKRSTQGAFGLKIATLSGWDLSGGAMLTFQPLIFVGIISVIPGVGV